MLNVGAGELIFILVAALLILGPKRLPELARSVGKFVREFRRQTDDVRGVVEREFYRMDQEISTSSPPLERRAAGPASVLPPASPATPAPGITPTPAPGTTPSAAPGTTPVAVAGAGTSSAGSAAGGGSSAPADAPAPTPSEPRS